MALGDGMLRPPSLADDLNEMDRRLRVVEFGDPNDINSRFGGIDARIRQLVTEGVQPPLNDTFTNDGRVSNYTYNSILAINNWIAGGFKNYVGQVALWYVHQHEYAMHPPSPPPGAMPTWSYPGFPAQPNLIVPTIVWS